jgi:hypothetical protein
MNSATVTGPLAEMRRFRRSRAVTTRRLYYYLVMVVLGTTTHEFP